MKRTVTVEGAVDVAWSETKVLDLDPNQVLGPCMSESLDPTNLTRLPGLIFLGQMLRR